MASPSDSSMADAMGKRNHDEVDFDSDTEEETTSARNPSDSW